MAGWTEVQQEEGVSWITVCSYGDKKAPEEGHLAIVPGDVVIPHKQTEDWMFGTMRDNQETSGIFPKAFVRQVGQVDSIAEKARTTIEYIFQSGKSSWSEAKEYDTSDAGVNHRELVRDKLEELMDMRRARIRCLSKLSDVQLQENSQNLADYINGFPEIRKDNIIVDSNIDNLRTEDNTYTELYRLHRNKTKSKVKRISKDFESTYRIFSLTEIKPTKEAMEYGKVDYTLGLYHRVSGFLTDFFSYQDMNNPDTTKQNAKKKFGIPEEFKENDMKDVYLVLMVVFTDGSLAKKCKGIGLTKLENIFEKDELKLNINSNKDSALSVIEQITKFLKEKDQETNYFKFTFQIKTVRESFLKPEDFVFRKVTSPTLCCAGLNKLVITLDTAKIVGSGKIWIGDSFSVSMDVEIRDAEGNTKKYIQTCDPNEKSSVYQTVTSPNNLKCDWKETFHLDLKRDQTKWKNLHLRFNIYKHPTDKSPKRLYGFAYLPLKNENDTILCDGTYELFVFQIHRGYEPVAEDYLNKGLYIYDRNIKNVKALNDKGFSVMTSDILTVKTRLISTEMTDDPTIFALLTVDPERFGETKINQMFERYIQSSDTDPSKRILFMTQILDKLWKILNLIPNQENHVFDGFVETIHPIITNKKEFGYAASFLERYIEKSFNCPEVFEKFIGSFQEMIKKLDSVDVISGTGNTYTMMSMKFIFKFIVKAYKLNKKNYAAFDSDLFCQLLQTLGEFLKKRSGNRMLHSQTFKALFDVDTMNIISEIVPGIVIVDILKDILEAEDINSKDCNRFNAVRDLLNSNFFLDEASQEAICNVGIKLISDQFPKNSRNYDAPFQKGPLKECTLELIKNLYEVCKKLENVESRDKFVGMITIQILPRLITIIPMRSQDAIYKNERLEEVLLTTLISEITEDTFEDLLKQENAESMLDKLFKIFQRTSECQYLPESSELRMFAYKHLAEFFRKISAKGILDLANRKMPIIENFFLAVTSIIGAKDLMVENFTKEKYKSVLDQYGDLRVILANILKDCIAKFDKETLLELLRFDEVETKMLDALFNASLDVKHTGRTILINLLFTLIHAEFFAEDKYKKNQVNKSILISYTWFIERVIKSFKNNTSFVDFNYKSMFKSCMQNKLSSIHYSLHLDVFKQKIGMMILHIDKLVTATFDSVRVNQKFKEDEEQIYFSHITACYNLYSVLQEIGNEAMKENLLHSEDTVIRDLCIELLINLYELYDRKNLIPSSIAALEVDNVSAGFTLQKLGDLIPWSLEEANRGTAMRINNWIITHKIILDDENEDFRRRTVSPAGLGNHVTWSTLKDAVQKLSIKKFRDASGFECSIEMMERSIDRYKSEIFDYKALSKAYKNLSEIYEYRYNFNQKLIEDQKIEDDLRKEMESSRRNILDPEYYRISFYNAPLWLRFLSNKTFIYRGDAMLKMSDLEEKIKKWFPKSKIMKQENIDIRKSEVGGLDNMIIQLSKVDAILTQGKEFIGKKVPPQVLKYGLKNSTDVFIFKKMFEKMRNKDNPSASTYGKNWLFETEFQLPGMLKWSIVTSESPMIESTPILNTLTMLQEKNLELEMDLRKLEQDPKCIPLQKVGQNLYGVVLASVGGGIPKIEEAFLTPEYEDEHEDEKDLLQELKQEIIKQTKIVEGLLPIHDQYKDDSMGPMHDAISEKFEETKTHVHSKYGTTYEDTFKEPTLNRMLLKALNR
eukprot:GFUD01019303.1.p1 GENE.GFUD01019303.1~~GFUD01019303.1.p1  ORF type:complete len:1705 (+),score=380.42 GFUD01019303.1:51-5165(+)